MNYLIMEAIRILLIRVWIVGESVATQNVLLDYSEVKEMFGR